MNLTWEDHDKNFEIVWVVMSQFSAQGVRGAPSAIFKTREDAISWVEENQIRANIYKLPIGLSLTEYCEPILGNETFITKHFDKSQEEYKSGICYLGFIEHDHFA